MGLMDVTDDRLRWECQFMDDRVPGVREQAFTLGTSDLDERLHWERRSEYAWTIIYGRSFITRER